MTHVLRRAATALGVAALATVLVLEPAVAQDVKVGSGTYRGTLVRTIAEQTTPAAIPVGGFLMRDFGQSKPTVRVTLKPTPCSATATQVLLDDDELVGGRWRSDFRSTAALPFDQRRNGDYTVVLCVGGAPELEQTFVTRYPVPTVEGVVATASGRSIAVTWNDMSPDAPDVSGYKVQRRLGADGDFVEIASVKENVFSVTDTALPAAAGDATYRVIATRPFVADASPSGESSASFAAAPPSTVPGGTDSGSDAGSDAGTDAGSDGGTGTPTTRPGGGTDNGGTGDGGGSGGTTPRRTNRVIVRAPRLGMPSNAFFPPLLTPPASEVDTGFDENLPYDPETGELEPVLPDDELASAPTDELPGNGLVVPVATALLLAVWAFHLRYLAKASKPVYLDDYLEPLD